MLINSYTTSEGKEYLFTLTIKSKIAIEKYRSNLSIANASALSGLTPEEREKLNRVIELRNQLEKELNAKKKDEKKIEELNAEAEALAMEVIPLMSKIENAELNNDEMNIEVAWLVFHNYKENRSLSREDFDNILEDMEETKGIQYTLDFLGKIKDKVFTFLDKNKKN